MFGLPFLNEKTIWLSEILLALFLLGLGLVLLRLTLHLLQKKAKEEKKDKILLLERIIFHPARLLIWVLSISYIFAIFAEHFDLPKFLNKIYFLRNGLFVLIITWLLLLWKKEVLHLIIRKGVRKKTNWDRHSIDFLGKMGTLFIVFMSALIFLQVLGVNIVPLVAFGGIGAAAIGFAAKDVIANFFGGLMIYLTRPYSLGDDVELPNHKLFGQVEEMGWYMTCIRNNDKVPVYIPNALFSTALIMNSSRRSHRKFEQTLSLRYKDFSKIFPILKKIRGYLDSHEKVDSSQPTAVYFSELGAYSLDIYILAYLNTISLMESLALKEELLLEIKKMVAEEGANMPFPTTHIEMENS